MIMGIRIIACCLLYASVYSLSGQSKFTSSHSPASAFPVDLDPVKVDSFYKSRTIDFTLSSNPDLYFEIYRWYKTCYQYGGKTGKGIDCSHFVNMLYEKVYKRKLQSSSASIFTQCKALKGGIAKAKEGDLLFFKIRKKQISHVGIYLQKGLFVHASTQAGVIISDLKEDYYQKHFFKAGRLD
jgi:murein DD-endopeptidase / murein LD-carboxypeptidase